MRITELSLDFELTKDTHTSPLPASYGVSFVTNFVRNKYRKISRVSRITAKLRNLSNNKIVVFWLLHFYMGHFIDIHYSDVIMETMTSQITSLTIVYSTVYSGADVRKHKSSPSLAFVRGIHRWPVNSPHKWPVTRKMFPFDDVIIICQKMDIRLLACVHVRLGVILLLVNTLKPEQNGRHFADDMFIFFLRKIV